MSESPSKVQDLLNGLRRRDLRAIGRAISLVEDQAVGANDLLAALDNATPSQASVVGVTGAPGSGKSTLTDQLISRYRRLGHRVGVIAIDPSSPHTGGALLGDRIRMMRHATDPDVVMRSMATRQRLGGLCAAASVVSRIMSHTGCQRILIETVGVGQTEMDVARVADLTLLVMAPGMGDEIQAMKAGLVEMADVLVVNKSDRPGADQLAHEMGMVAHERGKSMCVTNAVDGSGVGELIEEIDRLDSRQLQTGERERRRRAVREYEVLEWAVALLRPQLESIIRRESTLTGDPHGTAQRLIEAFLNGHSPS